MLAYSYKNSMAVALEHNIKSIAFPNISTGIYQFPKDRAAEIAIKTVKEFLDASRADIKVTFACFDEENYRIYERLLN